MTGYWRNPTASEETLTKDGWLKTGDVCYRDKKGVYFIVDRRKELIKVKGLQVAPAELEAVLLEHEKVADAGVVGVTIDGEECPRAYIMLKEGQKVTADEVNKYMESRVSRHKRLVGGVVFVDAIPKNPVSCNSCFLDNFANKHEVWKNPAKGATGKSQKGGWRLRPKADSIVDFIAHGK